MYNTNNLRILWEIGTDGLQYNNIITATSGISADYGVLNIKSDLLEAKYRVAEKNIFIQIDVGRVDDGTTPRTKSIAIDTLGLLSTNLTLDAIIQVYGYGDAYSSTPLATIIQSQGTLIISKSKRDLCNNDEYQNDLVYVSDDEDTRQFRHFLILIQDLNNLNSYLEIGRLIGGQSTILEENNLLNGASNFNEQFNFEEIVYSDTVNLNGYSTIANERAVRRKVSLEFSNLNIISSNYRALKRMWGYCKDNKKMLVIPAPTIATYFHCYAKLANIPKQTINYVDNNNIFSNFTLEFDEAK